MGYERAFERKGHDSLGGQMRQLVEQMQAVVLRLQEMCTFAQDNEKTNIHNHLKNILKSFNELKDKYMSTNVMSEIEHASLKSAAKSDPHIEKIRDALRAAAQDLETVAREEMRDIQNLLMTSSSQVAYETRHAQGLYENFNDFISQRNQFIELLDKIDTFEKVNKTKYAKNSAQFFTTAPYKSTKSSIEVEVKDKKHKPTK